MLEDKVFCETCFKLFEKKEAPKLKVIRKFKYAVKSVVRLLIVKNKIKKIKKLNYITEFIDDDIRKVWFQGIYIGDIEKELHWYLDDSVRELRRVL
jgi:hypothetical protein